MKLEDKLRSQKWLPKYIEIKAFISAGRSQTDFVVNAFKIGFYVVGILFLAGIDLRGYQSIIPLLSLNYLILMYIIGRGWDALKGFDYAADFSNKRNPMLRRIHNVVKNSSKAK